MQGLSRHSHFTEEGLGAAITGPASEAKANELDAPWQREFLEIFLRGQIRLAPLLPIVTIIIALTAWIWEPWPMVLGWAMLAGISHIVQIYLSQMFLERAPHRYEQRDWIGVFAASEALQAATWSMSLYLLWPEGDLRSQGFLIAAMMALIVMRFLLASNYMPVLIAGSGTLAVALAWRCIIEGGQVLMSVAVLVFMLEAFFLYIARNMQATTRDMIVYRQQKAKLIEELKVEKEHADDEREKALEANRAKSTFLANMSHELRTPLNAIIGFSEIINREMFGPVSNPTYKSYAGDIHNSGAHLLSLINDILDLSRIEAGRRDLREEPVALSTCAEEAQKLTAIRATHKGLDIKIVMAPNLPKILADRRAVEQVIINLLTNAVKFTPDGGKIEIRAVKDSNGDMLLTVKDNGPGIPEDEVRQAMTAFTRGTFATKRDIDGAGLGLPIVRGLMTLHDGELKIKSTPRIGTEVLCRFPQSRVLSGPRSQIIEGPLVKTDNQHRLIRLTG